MALVRIPSFGTSRSFSRFESHHLGDESPGDASFYWRRLRRTALLAVLLAMANVFSGGSGSMKASTKPSASVAGQDADSKRHASIRPDFNPTEPVRTRIPAFAKMRFVSESSDHAGSTDRTLISSGPRAVPPVGWRRTANGWENSAEWPAAHSQKGGISAQVSLSDQILLQQKREPAVLRRSMDTLRSTHPAIIASVQVASVLVLFATWMALREKPLRQTGRETPKQLAS